MYEKLKMNHLKTPKKSVFVTDILEKLPNNLSEMSIPFQMSDMWQVFFLFPWIYN